MRLRLLAHQPSRLIEPCATMCWRRPTPNAPRQTERFALDEAEFDRFYDATIRPLQGYLTRLSGNFALADDLTQEAYCRLLTAAAAPGDADRRRRYLYRIATNLYRDHYRRARWDGGSLDEMQEPADRGVERRLQLRGDVGNVLDGLTSRQRALLWLAYVEGMQHREIAEVLGLSRLSIRPLLFRARRRMARELRARGIGPVGVAGRSS